MNQQQNIHSLTDFLAYISQYGHRTAIIVHDGTQERKITYQQLVNDVMACSKVFAQKITPGERVILYHLDGYEWVRAFFTCAVAGGVATSIDSRASKEFELDIIKLVQPKLIIGKQLTTPTPEFPIAYENVNEYDYSQSYHDFIPPQFPTNLPFEIVFTSGTWAKPKGVTLSQDNIKASFEACLQYFYPDPDEVFLSVLPLNHIYEQMGGLFIPLFRGCTIVYTPLNTKEQFTQALKTYKPTTMITVPIIMELMYETYKKKLSVLFPVISYIVKLSRYVLPQSVRRLLFWFLRLGFGGRLRHVLVGGAPFPIEVDRFFQGLGIRVDVGYGLSETAPIVSASLDQFRRPGEVGKLLPILEAKTGENGEIILRGPNVFMGYWPNISNTTETWFHTGDVGVFTHDHKLILLGRLKSLFIYPTGDKIFADDIEYVANKQADVIESCCVNTGLGLNNNLVLVITGKNIDTRLLLKSIESKLPSFVSISQVLIYSEDSLPQTHTRKLNRQAVLSWVKQVQMLQ